MSVKGVRRLSGGAFWAVAIGAVVVIGAGYVLGHEWRLISDYIKTHLPLVFMVITMLVAAYLLYRYRASLPWLGWMRSKKEEVD